MEDGITEPTLKPRFLSRRQAVAYLGDGVIAESTLAKYACVGGGPKFYKIGSKVGYTTEDLDAYAKAQVPDAGRDDDDTPVAA